MTVMTQEELKSVLSYDPNTGRFTWVVSLSPRVRAGAEAGNTGKTGYRKIGIFGKYYLASRLAHLYMTGSWPVAEIDHRDCNQANDAWENLRQATRSQNLANRKPKKLRIRGSLKGTCFVPSENRWLSSIRHLNHRKHLGYFRTEQEAHDAYMVAAHAIHGDYVRAA